MDQTPGFAIGEPFEDSAVLAVTGEVDMASAPELERQLTRALGAGPGGLVLDLSRVTFIDSTAMTALIHALERLHQRGGHAHVVATDPRLRALFEVAGMEKHFALHSSRDEALAEVSGRAVG